MNDEVLIPMLERYAMTRDTALRDELFEKYLPLSRAVATSSSGAARRGISRPSISRTASYRV